MSVKTFRTITAVYAAVCHFSDTSVGVRYHNNNRIKDLSFATARQAEDFVMMFEATIKWADVMAGEGKGRVKLEVEFAKSVPHVVSKYVVDGEAVELPDFAEALHADYVRRNMPYHGRSIRH